MLAKVCYGLSAVCFWLLGTCLLANICRAVNNCKQTERKPGLALSSAADNASTAAGAAPALLLLLTYPLLRFVFCLVSLHFSSLC